MMYNLQSTRVIEWPALALGFGLLSESLKLLQCSHVDVYGSNVYRSLKQNAWGPLPPKRNSLSVTLHSSIPALGAGLSPTTAICDQMNSFKLNTNKSFSLFEPSQPPKIYRLSPMMLELWLALGGGLVPWISCTLFQWRVVVFSSWRSLR